MVSACWWGSVLFGPVYLFIFFLQFIMVVLLSCLSAATLIILVYSCSSDSVIVFLSVYVLVFDFSKEIREKIIAGTD